MNLKLCDIIVKCIVGAGMVACISSPFWGPRLQGETIDVNGRPYRIKKRNDSAVVVSYDNTRFVDDEGDGKLDLFESAFYGGRPPIRIHQRKTSSDSDIGHYQKRFSKFYKEGRKQFPKDGFNIKG